MNRSFIFKHFKTIFITVLVLNLTIGGLATEYAVEFWNEYFTGEFKDIPYFPCAVAGLFLGELLIPMAALTYLASFVL